MYQALGRSAHLEYLVILLFSNLVWAINLITALLSIDSSIASPLIFDLSGSADGRTVQARYVRISLALDTLLEVVSARIFLDFVCPSRQSDDDNGVSNPNQNNKQQVRDHGGGGAGI